jgi:hypothetical protein
MHTIIEKHFVEIVFLKCDYPPIQLIFLDIFIQFHNEELDLVFYSWLFFRSRPFMMNLVLNSLYGLAHPLVALEYYNRQSVLGSYTASEILQNASSSRVRPDVSGQRKYIRMPSIRIQTE